MRQQLPKKLEDGRIRHGEFASDPAWGGYGKFTLQGPCGEKLVIIASGGDMNDVDSQGWEHVSVSTRRRPPNWQEMCFIKNLFWDESECVVQFHPPQTEYVNNHPFCLHLWRNNRIDFPRPPSIMVGVKSAGILTPETARTLRIFMETTR